MFFDRYLTFSGVFIIIFVFGRYLTFSGIFSILIYVFLISVLWGWKNFGKDLKDNRMIEDFEGKDVK